MRALPSRMRALPLRSRCFIVPLRCAWTSSFPDAEPICGTNTGSTARSPLGSSIFQSMGVSGTVGRCPTASTSGMVPVMVETTPDRVILSSGTSRRRS